MDIFVHFRLVVFPFCRSFFVSYSIFRSKLSGRRKESGSPRTTRLSLVLHGFPTISLSEYQMTLRCSCAFCLFYPLRPLRSVLGDLFLERYFWHSKKYVISGVGTQPIACIFLGIPIYFWALLWNARKYSDFQHDLDENLQRCFENFCLPRS